jgi:hypothetical protein
MTLLQYISWSKVNATAITTSWVVNACTIYNEILVLYSWIVRCLQFYRHLGWAQPNAHKNNASQIWYVPGFYATVGQSPQKYKTGVSMYKKDTYFPNTFFMKYDINLLL